MGGGPLRRRSDVRFGSKADICAATSDVCFTPDSDHESGYLRFVMSALPPRADMCGATRDVRFGPIADPKALTNAETTNLYLGFRSLGCVSTKISSDNRTETQLVSMKTDTPTAKWPAAGSKSVASATISKKIAVSAWMEKYNLAITGNGASVTTRLISGQDTVKTAIKIAAVKLETRLCPLWSNCGQTAT
jgi:hypothetical protein